MVTMNLIIYVTSAVVLLLSGSQSEETPPSSDELNHLTPSTTTPDWVPTHPHTSNSSHGASEDDSKEADDDSKQDDEDDDNDDGDDDDKSIQHDDVTDDGTDDLDDGEYPNPRKHPQECKVGADPAWICDKDDVLDDKTANEINDLLKSMVEAKGICPCQDVSCSYTGFPMAVVVLHSIPEYENKSDEEKEDHVHDLARRFLNDWDFNTCNDGAVTIVVSDDEIVVTEIGQASEYLVPDDCQEFVENETSDLFEDGRIKEGLTNLIQQYRLIVEKNHSCNSDAHLKRSIIIPIILIIALIIVILIVALVVVIYRRRGSKDIRTEANVPLKDQHAEKA